MKYIRMLLAAIGVFVGVGTIGTALADDDNHRQLTLYSPPLKGSNIICDLTNVSYKTLDIVVTILDKDGVQLSTTDPTNFTVLPGTMVESAHHEADPTNSLDGYCKFEVFGTRNRDDVRADLVVTSERTIPGTTIPTWVFRGLEAH